MSGAKPAAILGCNLRSSKTSDARLKFIDSAFMEGYISVPDDFDRIGQEKLEALSGRRMNYCSGTRLLCGRLVNPSACPASGLEKPNTIMNSRDDDHCST